MVATTSSRRRSPRLLALADESASSFSDQDIPKPTKRARKSAKGTLKKKDGTTLSAETSKSKSSTEKTTKSKCSEKDVPEFLARTREKELKEEFPELKWIMGIDEAGRGPLCGPVVAAACIIPINIEGIMDSKKISKEDAREELYEQIVACHDIRWAVAVVDAPTIDDINILQATMKAMSMAANALVVDGQDAIDTWKDSSIQGASASRDGCYVVCGGELPPQSSSNSGASNNEKTESTTTDSYFALVDGNRVPKDLSCGGEAMVKGDLREYSIAAASILAKVTRDRLMHEYDKMYTGYNIGQHKGYPTKAHIAAILRLGKVSPIYRKTFAPLKHMEFDKDGRILST